MGLVLSTSWNAWRHKNGKKIIAEIEKLGFEQVELSFNLTDSIVRDIKDLAANKHIIVSSLHNFCPIPQGIERHSALPDFYSMASTDGEERQKSLKYTKTTIDTALDLGAAAVVLHCGRVEIPDKTRSLTDLCLLGMDSSEDFIKIRNEYAQQRRQFQQAFFDNALRSLDELNRYAESKNILLGVETRIYHREIPSFEETAVILDKFKGSNIFYWHDTGHAQINEKLGFSSHKQYLDSYADKMIGIHLHDVSAYKDHKAPSCGEIDFTMLRPYIKKNTIKVVEVHHPTSPAEIRKGKEYLERVFDAENLN